MSHLLWRCFLLYCVKWTDVNKSILSILRIPKSFWLNNLQRIKLDFLFYSPSRPTTPFIWTTTFLSMDMQFSIFILPNSVELYIFLADALLFYEFDYRPTSKSHWKERTANLRKVVFAFLPCFKVLFGEKVAKRLDPPAINFPKWLDRYVIWTHVISKWRLKPSISTLRPLYYPIIILANIPNS